MNLIKCDKTNHNILFQWLFQNLNQHFNEDKNETSTKCRDFQFGQFFYSFGYDLIIDFLDLTDEELEEEFPFDSCPMNVENRRKLKQLLEEHAHSCSFCREYILAEKIEESIIEFVLSEKESELAIL